MNSPTRTIHGESAWHLESDTVRLDITTRGGQLAPVEFLLSDDHWASPYSLSPWQPNDQPDQPPLLQVLRGDFFCFPFGVTEGIELPHGESANRPWTLQSMESGSATLTMDVGLPTGRITKRIGLRNGHRALYQEHELEGFTGRFNYGHHPILAFPEGSNCPIRVSPFRFGQVYPGQFAADPEVESTCLLPGGSFTDLAAIPLRDGGTASLASYPSLDGFEDLLMISASTETQIGWTAVGFQDFVWLALRDTADFPSTLFWISNGGRRQAPWDGRHLRRLGIEDVCSHFHDGAHVSSRDLLSDLGIATSRRFSPSESTRLRHIQMVVPTKGPKAVARIEFQDAPTPGLALTYEDGTTSEAPIDWQWLRG